MSQPTDFTDVTLFIQREGNALVTDSRAVAIAFEKQHRNVLRTIAAMRVNPHREIAEHSLLNFEQCSYVSAKGNTQPMYRMTAKGLSELAMSFSGDKARVVRIRFLNAFEEVAAGLARSDRSITEMLHQHDKRSAVSEAKARIGSLLMHGRRKEKPELDTELQALRDLAQPPLLN